MNLEELIKKYQDIYYQLITTPNILRAQICWTKAFVDDLIAFQTEVKEKLEAMKSPRSHLNPVLILKELIE